MYTNAMHNSAMRKFSFILFAVVVLIIGYNWIGWPYQVRFYSSKLNGFILSLLYLLLPISMFLAAIFTRNKLLKMGGVIVSLIISLPLGFLAFFSSIDTKLIIERGEDYSMELLDQTSTSTGTLRLYRTNCGATCSFGLLLRKEIDTPIGIKFVRSEWSMYKEDEATLQLVSNSLRVLSDGRTIYELAK